VIDRLAPGLLEFLVRVSVLDVVSAELADALTGGQNGAATLAELAAANLFVQAVGSGAQWYRLHRLIADVLRTRITERRMFRDLHRRAAEWYAHQAMPLEAVRYAVRGGLWPLAAELLGAHLVAFAVRGDARDIDMLLSAVPRDALLSHPELAAALAIARILQGSPSGLGELVAAAHAGVSRLPGPRAERLRVVLHLIEIGHGRARGDLVSVAAACRQLPENPTVLAKLGLAAWDVVPLLVLGNAGTAELWTGDLAEAEKHLRAALDIDRSGGLLRPQLNAAAHLALLHCQRGDLDAAHDEARDVVEHAVDAGWTVSAQVASAYLTLAWVALDRDDHPEADAWLARVAEVEAAIPEPHIQLAAAALTALRRADAGDLVGALSGLRLTAARLRGSAPEALADRLVQVEADLLCRMGDVSGAGNVLAGLRGPATASSMRAVARLHLYSGDLAAAEAALARFPDDGATVRGRVEGAILHSTVAAPQDRAIALSRLEDALLAAAPPGMRRPFLVSATHLRGVLAARIEAGTGVAAFAVDLMRRMSGQVSRPPAVLAAPLTDREQLVLRYLASTLSNAEIASELYLSVNTVKSHQRMVYRKLGADGRRDAVRRAKELRLI
jgi:LuxR family maltose regulon positive regulatory protein